VSDLPADIERSIADLIRHAKSAGKTNAIADHSLTAMAQVTLETVIAKHLRGMAEMKAALEAQTSGA